MNIFILLLLLLYTYSIDITYLYYVDILLLSDTLTATYIHQQPIFQHHMS